MRNNIYQTSAPGLYALHIDAAFCFALPLSLVLLIPTTNWRKGSWGLREIKGAFHFHLLLQLTPPKTLPLASVFYDLMQSRLGIQGASP